MAPSNDSANDYSKRELDRMFKEITDSLSRIEAQTTRTNGRVTSLQIWRGYITGGLAILSLIVFPMAFWVVCQVVSIKPNYQSASVIQSEK